MQSIVSAVLWQQPHQKGSTESEFLVVVSPEQKGSHYKGLWHKAQRGNLCWVCATSLQNQPEPLCIPLLERTTHVNHSGCSQSCPATSYGSVSVLLLQLKVKLVVERTKEMSVCIEGKD